MKEYGSTAIALLSVGLFLANPTPAFSGVLLEDDFEDGNVAGWYTWTSQGTITNVVGPGFDPMAASGDPYKFSGQFGLQLSQDWPTTGANTAEIPTLPGTGAMCLSFDVRPYVDGGSNNDLLIHLGEVSGLVSQTGFSVLGVAFGADGSVRAEDLATTSLGTYTKGAWCHVEISLNTDTDLFDIEVSGAGVGASLSATDLSFRQSMTTVNFLHIQDNGIGLPNGHGVDDIQLVTGTCEPPVATEKTSWATIKSIYR